MVGAGTALFQEKPHQPHPMHSSLPRRGEIGVFHFSICIEQLPKAQAGWGCELHMPMRGGAASSLSRQHKADLTR